MISPATLFKPLAAGVAHAVLYLVFVGETGWRELIAAALVGAIATLAIWVFSFAGKVHFRLRWVDVLQGWRLGWYALTGTVEVLKGLALQLFTKDGAPSFLAAMPFHIGPPADAGRRALEVTYTCATPNFVVLGEIKKQKLLLYHQIVPGKVLTMTRRLGRVPMTPMNPWLWAAAGILLALVPAGIVCFRGEVGDRLVGLEFTSVLVTIELMLLAEGFHRPSFFDLPLTLALLSFGGGMVFARFVQRWF